MSDAAPALRSFADQARHYFQREHASVARRPLRQAAAWRGGALRSDGDWQVRLRPEWIDELERAADAALARGIGPRDLARLGRDDFRLERLAGPLRALRGELSRGRGFAVLRGLPVERWGEARSALAFWGLGLHLGVPGAQNPQGDCLGHVRDTREDASDPFVRRYRTAGRIAFHCDLADVVGLLCLQPAGRGGESRIASSVAVYDELLRRAPERVARLYEPFLLDLRGEQRPGQPPCIAVPPCRHANGVLRTFYHADYFRSVARHPEVGALPEADLALLDLYESTASDPALRLDMHFEPGDVQLLSNHFVVHARGAYEDDPQSGRSRHLLRLWLSLHPEPGSDGGARGAAGRPR